MSKSRLITPSLISAINWARNAPNSHVDHDDTKPTWREKAQVDLRNTLARVYDEPMSSAAKRGIAFENAVYNAVKSGNLGGSEHFRKFVEECKGGMFQVVSKKMLTLDGADYCLYGKIDAWWPYELKDLKTTGKRKSASDYLDTFQHKQYCFTEHIDKFVYLVAEFDGDSPTQILRVHRFEYQVNSWASLEAEVHATIRDAMKFLSADPELFELYTTTFSKY